MKKLIYFALLALSFNSYADDHAKNVVLNLIKDEAKAFINNKSSIIDDINIVTAGKLINDYENNQARYERDYDKKLVRISALAHSIKTDLLGKAYVVVTGQNQFEQVTLYLKDKNKAMDISKGDKVDFICEGSKVNVMYPQLNKCVDTKDYIKKLVDLNVAYINSIKDNEREVETRIGSFYLSILEYNRNNENKIKTYSNVLDLIKRKDKSFKEAVKKFKEMEYNKKHITSFKLPPL